MLYFTSHNPHKIEEIRAITGPDLVIKGLDDLGCDDDIPEPYETLEENAMAKATFVADKYQVDCFADDTGLEVDALGGLPGVHSARYAGPEKDSSKNMQKLLDELGDAKDRKARFRTVIALVMKGSHYYFEGVAEGSIALQPSGKHGFGYDPIFIPAGYTQTFADLPAHEKNRISHRKRAIAKLAVFFKRNHVAFPRG